MIAAFLVLVLQTSAPVPAAQPTPPSAPVQPERRICRPVSTTGSIMPAKRVCHLRGEWAAIDAANDRTMEGFRNRPQNGRPSGS